MLQSGQRTGVSSSLTMYVKVAILMHFESWPYDVSFEDDIEIRKMSMAEASERLRKPWSQLLSFEPSRICLPLSHFAHRS